MQQALNKSQLFLVLEFWLDPLEWVTLSGHHCPISKTEMTNMLQGGWGIKWDNEQQLILHN